MGKKRDVYELLDKYRFLNYVWWLLEGNILFWLTSFPFLLTLLIFNFKFNNLLSVITSIFIGPSLFALIYAIIRAGEDGGILKNYFISYKKYFISVLKVWIPVMVIFFLIIFNINFLSQFKTLLLLKLLNIFLMCILLTATLNILIVKAKYEFENKKCIDYCFKLAFIKSIRYNMNFLIMISTYILLSLVPVYLYSYGVAIACLLSVKNFVPVFQFIDENRE
ncbi:hypothetical protein [Clostridium hydrogenum]|uniref:hypothetical protein n=1 Tax=Clostridium hydrogenum TaxID=2855764 RepID=UPI001F477001|nr:hypothetical protein [Clostridium hydrogenum]